MIAMCVRLEGKEKPYISPVFDAHTVAIPVQVPGRVTGADGRGAVSLVVQSFLLVHNEERTSLTWVPLEKARPYSYGYADKEIVL